MQSLLERFGATGTYVLGAVAAVVVLLILVLVIRAVFNGRIRATVSGRTRQPRLGIVDAFDLDRQRQLVLVRRDYVEHLIMIGGPNDVVVESQIVRASAAGEIRSRAAGSEDTSYKLPGAPARAPVPSIEELVQTVNAPPQQPMPPQTSLQATVPAPATRPAPLPPPPVQRSTIPLPEPPVPEPTRAAARPAMPEPARTTPQPVSVPPPPVPQRPLEPVAARAGAPEISSSRTAPPVDSPLKKKFDFKRAPAVEGPPPPAKPGWPSAPVAGAPKPPPTAPATPQPPQPASAAPADPVDALEAEMAKLLGRPH